MYGVFILGSSSHVLQLAFSFHIIMITYLHSGNFPSSFPGTHVPPLRHVVSLHSKASVKMKHKQNKLNLVALIVTLWARKPATFNVNSWVRV